MLESLAVLSKLRNALDAVTRRVVGAGESASYDPPCFLICPGPPCWIWGKAVDRNHGFFNREQMDGWKSYMACGFPRLILCVDVFCRSPSSTE